MHINKSYLLFRCQKKTRVYKLYEYSESDLEKALERCRNGESYRKVAADLNIPKSTICAKINEKTPLHAKRGRF